MKNVIKGGLILAALLAGSAHAAIVNFDMSGKVNYGYGLANQGDTAHLNFKVDTSVAPSYSYGYNGGSWGYTESVFNNSVNPFSGNVGNTAFSGANGSTVGYAYNENWFGYQYSGAEVYNWANTANGYQAFGVYSSSNTPINTQDLVSALMSGGNGLSFFFEKYDSSNWSSYTYATGTFDNVKVGATPIPAAFWLFGSALTGLLGIGKRKSTYAETLVTA